MRNYIKDNLIGNKKVLVFSYKLKKERQNKFRLLKNNMKKKLIKRIIQLMSYTISYLVWQTQKLILTIILNTINNKIMFIVDLRGNLWFKKNIYCKKNIILKIKN